MQLTHLVFFAFLVATLSVAFGRGGRDERIGGVMVLVAALATPMVQLSLFSQVERGILAVDVLLLVGLVALAVRSNRHWPMIATGFHATNIALHLARSALAGLDGDAYADASVFWSYPVLLTLLLGSVLERRKWNQAAASDTSEDAPTPANQVTLVTVRSHRNDAALLTHLFQTHELGPTSGHLAHRLLTETGSLGAMLASSPPRLRALGASDRAITALALVRQLITTTLRGEVETRPQLTGATATLDYLSAEMAHLPREQFRVLYLNSKLRLVHDEVHTLGSVSEAPVYPREIITRALESGATKLILAHNHPTTPVLITLDHVQYH